MMEPLQEVTVLFLVWNSVDVTHMQYHSEAVILLEMDVIGAV